MRQRQFLLYTRQGDIELGRREGTEEGASGRGEEGGGGGGGEGVKVCVRNSRNKMS